MDYLLSRFNSFSLDRQGLTPQNLLDKTNRHWNHNPGSDTLIVCLPGWGQKLWNWKMVEKYVKQEGYSFLAYEFPKPILSDSVNLTLECFKTINSIVREDIKNLKKKYGFNKCILTGISLASSFGSIVYKDNPDVTDILLVVPGENLARDMWHGCRTQHLRKSFELQGVSLEELENNGSF